MAGPVTLPFWVAAALFLLASWAVLERLLVPGVLWFLRRRVNRFVEEVNRRLHLEIHPFALTKRRVLIDRLMFDPAIVNAAASRARENNMPRNVAMAEAERYAREIVPSFNAYAYFRVGYWIARRIARLLYRVRVGVVDETALSAVPPRSSVVFVMNHRSNMDYILVAYLAATRTALSYAVGEWAKVWPLQTLVRSMGAYFIRRGSGNSLYRLVLERYVHMATQGGVVQAIYPEGGLTRDGSLQPAKLGLLDYMVRSFDPAGERDLVFLPVGINYDRTLEDRALLLEKSPGDPGKSPVRIVGTFLSFFFRNLYQMVRGRWYRFGYACVIFGTPIYMKRYCRERGVDFRSMDREERFDRVGSLASLLMSEVGKAIPVLPVSLVATVFLRRAQVPVSLLELKADSFRLIRTLVESGARIHIPRRDQDYAIEVGLRMLTLRRIVEETEGMFLPVPGELPLLRYYANAIRHLLPGES